MFATLTEGRLAAAAGTGAGFPWALVALGIVAMGVLILLGYLLYLWGRARHRPPEDA